MKVIKLLKSLFKRFVVAERNDYSMTDASLTVVFTIDQMDGLSACVSVEPLFMVGLAIDSYQATVTLRLFGKGVVVGPCFRLYPWERDEN